LNFKDANKYKNSNGSYLIPTQQLESDEREENMTLAKLKINALWKESHLNDEIKTSSVPRGSSELMTVEGKLGSDIEFALNDRDFDFIDDNNEDEPIIDLSSYDLEIPRIDGYHAVDTTKIDQQSQFTVVAIKDYKIIDGIHSFKAQWKDGR
jgi:hypothetical protein